MSVLSAVANEFQLGTVRDVRRLDGGSADVIALTTTSGKYVVKPVRQRHELELYAHVEQTLNQRDVRQPRLIPHPAGGYLSTSGHCVQEFFPGEISERPTPARSASLMRYLARYDAALREVPIPAWIQSQDTVWTRVVSPRFLLAELPGLATATDTDPETIRDGLARLGAAADRIDALDTQLVHGDHGPGNVLYDGDEVVAVLDFTPFRESVAFSVCTALYWHHVYGLGEPARDRIRADLESYGDSREWTNLVPALIVREALRRFATPLLYPGMPPARVRARYDALVSALKL